MEKEENVENLEIKIETTKLVTDDDKEKEKIEEESAKPTNIVKVEDPQHFASPKNIEQNMSNELKNNQNDGQKTNEANIFVENKIDIDDDLENDKKNDVQNSIKPSEIVENSQDTFNEKREVTESINPSNLIDGKEGEKIEEIKTTYHRGYSTTEY